MMSSLGDENPVKMMTDSGAHGNKGNIGQLGAMRGLMADPSGRITSTSPCGATCARG